MRWNATHLRFVVGTGPETKMAASKTLATKLHITVWFNTPIRAWKFSRPRDVLANRPQESRRKSELPVAKRPLRAGEYSDRGQDRLQEKNGNLPLAFPESPVRMMPSQPADHRCPASRGLLFLLDAPMTTALAHSGQRSHEETEPAPRPPLLTATEVANILVVSVRTLWRLDASGKLPLAVTIGRSKRWRGEELTAWINAGCPRRTAWCWGRSGKTLSTRNSSTY